MIGVIIKRRNLRQTNTQGKTPHEHKGRNQGYTSTSQEMPKVARKAREARREA